MAEEIFGKAPVRVGAFLFILHNKTTQMKKHSTYFFLLAFVSVLLTAAISLAGNPGNSITNLSKEQLIKEYSFYSADDLNGFDFIAQYKIALETEHIVTEQELKSFFYIAESKYTGKQNSAANQTFIRSNLSPNTELSSTCNNLDFEDGDFTNWEGYYGFNTYSCNLLNITSPNIYTLGQDAPTTACAFHTLISTAYPYDPYGNFPGVSANGGFFSARLGGDWINLANFQCANAPSSSYSGGEILEMPITITPANAQITLRYAVVLNDGGHQSGGQPYFQVELFDSAGNPLSSGCYDFCEESTMGIPPPGYFVSSVSQTVFYLPWDSTVINLSAYLGQQISVRYTAAGCNYGGHFAYAYVDADCGPAPSIIASGNMTCSGMDTLTLTAPLEPGGSYNWTGPGIIGSNISQTIFINSAGTYTVTITTSGGCTYSLSIIVAANTLSLITSVIPPTCVSCTDGEISLQPVGGSPGFTYTISPNAGNFVNNSFINLPADTYYVCVTDTNGCQFCDYVIVPPGATGISSLTGSANISFSPNPFNNGTTLNLDFIPQNAWLVIYDAIGNKITETEVSSTKTFLSHNIFPAQGMYFAILRNEKGMLARGKLIMN
jgi:hypothetical protein